MDKLGIEPTLLAAQIVNFFIIMIVLSKLLYKPLLAMIEKRKKEIAEGLALTQKMREEEEKLALKQEKALAKAREDAMLVIEEAKSQAKEVEKELIAETHKQAAIILDRAKEEAEELKKASQASIRREAVDLAVIMAKRVLGSALGVKEQHALIAKRIKDLESWAEKRSSPSK